MIHFSTDFPVTPFTVKSASETLVSPFDTFALCELGGLREGLFGTKQFLALVPHSCSAPACFQLRTGRDLLSLLSCCHPLEGWSQAPFPVARAQLFPYLQIQDLPSSDPQGSVKADGNKTHRGPAGMVSTTTHQRNFSVKTSEVLPQCSANGTSVYILKLDPTWAASIPSTHLCPPATPACCNTFLHICSDQWYLKKRAHFHSFFLWKASFPPLIFELFSVSTNSIAFSLRMWY